MNDITIANKKKEDSDVTIIFPNTRSFAWWIQQTRLTFNTAIITTFTAQKLDWSEKNGDSGEDFSVLVGDDNIVWIKKIVVNWKELKDPSFSDIISEILEDENSSIWTVIVHPEEF